MQKCGLFSASFLSVYLLQVTQCLPAFCRTQSTTWNNWLASLFLFYFLNNYNICTIGKFVTNYIILKVSFIILPCTGPYSLLHSPSQVHRPVLFSSAQTHLQRRVVHPVRQPHETSSAQQLAACGIVSQSGCH